MDIIRIKINNLIFFNIKAIITYLTLLFIKLN